jgi:hypothetical protein
MECSLRTRFALVQVGQLIKVHQLRLHVPYVIFAAVRFPTRIGSTVALHLRDSTTVDQTYYMYLPKRYGKTFTKKDIDDINHDRVQWYLVSKGPDSITNLYVLDVQ